MIISLMISQTLSLSYFPTLVLCFHLGYNQWDFFVGSWSPPKKESFSIGCLYTISIFSFQWWRMFRGNVCIWIKTNLFWFNEGQTHLTTTWHAKMNLTLNELAHNALRLDLHTIYFQACTEKLLTCGSSCLENNKLVTRSCSITWYIFYCRALKLDNEWQGLWVCRCIK